MLVGIAHCRDEDFEVRLIEAGVPLDSVDVSSGMAKHDNTMGRSARERGRPGSTSRSFRRSCLFPPYAAAIAAYPAASGHGGAPTRRCSPASIISRALRRAAVHRETTGHRHRVRARAEGPNRPAAHLLGAAFYAVNRPAAASSATY